MVNVNPLMFGLNEYYYYDDDKFKETAYNIAENIYKHYDTNYYSYVKELGDGRYNVVSELSVLIYGEYKSKALRLKKNLGSIEVLNVKHMLPIDVKGTNWLISPVYTSLDRIWNKLYENNESDVMRWLVYKYSICGLELIHNVHQLGYGVFDWKLHNFVVNVEDNALEMYICDVDMDVLGSRFHHTHSLHDIRGSYEEQDCMILIKDLHDLTQCIRFGYTYSNMFQCFKSFGYYLSDMNDNCYEVNNTVNELLKMIHEDYDEVSTPDVEFPDEMLYVKRVSEVIDEVKKDLTKEWRAKLRKRYGEPDYSIGITIPMQRILPPSIVA